MQQLYENYLTPSVKAILRITGIPEEEKEKGMEKLFKQIVDEDFPNLWKKLDL